jgi:hypothetical protein
MGKKEARKCIRGAKDTVRNPEAPTVPRKIIRGIVSVAKKPGSKYDALSHIMK